MNLHEQYFDSEFYRTEKHFSDFEKNEMLGTLTKGLWEVDDRLAQNPNLRFQRSESALVSLIYDGGAQPMLEGAKLPKQFMKFLTEKFLPRLNIRSSEVVSFSHIANFVFKSLDYEEPYFFLIDMPVALSQDNYSHTYIHKKTRCTLDPEKIEIFKVQMGWNFPHYTYVHKLLADERTATVARGGFVAHPSNTRNMDITDIIAPMFEAVYSSWDYSKNFIEHLMTNFYDDLKYDIKTADLNALQQIEDSREHDFIIWAAVTLGVFTWLKSPHGLRFLMATHPIYDAVLEWNEDTDRPMVAKDSGGFALVDGWTIYSARDLELKAGVKPGTCEVSGQSLHCTKLVNVHAVMHKCFCGKQRDVLNADEYSSESGHMHESCRRWSNHYNPPQMRFISYAALDNQLSGRDPKTKCQRHSCPNTACSYHAGFGHRIQSLTENRTRMLTGATSH